MKNTVAQPSPLRQVFETVLYSDDLVASHDFYGKALGLELLSENELMLVFRCGSQYLLIFNPKKSCAQGRLVPSHGMEGEGHIAFPTPEGEYQLWKDRLRSLGVPIESEVEWDDGERGRSLYVRDPSGNSVEFAPIQLWSHLHKS
ncbi:MAG: VOC family protein [Aureliella sp.]